MSKIKHGFITKAESGEIKSESQKALEKMKALEAKHKKRIISCFVGETEIQTTLPKSESKLYNYLKIQQSKWN